ncbi:hypothetical protein ACHHYP_13921 [Achlya hypogyna]|uniref:DDE Tnp4 domain-containing protein n=1 Tax=Achlya hypogyna TaxID=1202772 RepID=A0A1V9YEA4_ACHHY|nr:hypothetical protein ACHHYP_13921 [Achlya hypogyna]
MNEVIVVCTVVVVIAAIVCSDGRAAPSPKSQEFVPEQSSSIWFEVKNNPAMHAWFSRYLRCSRSAFFAIAKRLLTTWPLMHPPIHHLSIFAIEDRLAVALYYLTHCDGYDCTGLIFGIGKTKAYMFTKEVLDLIQLHHLQATIAAPATIEGWQQISDGFKRIAGLPRVFGAVDGSLVMIRRFRQHEGWYCRKGFPAFNVQASVDDRKHFMFYSIRAGAQNDKMLFKNSALGRSRFVPDDGYLLGDAGYRLLAHVSTPYPIRAGMPSDESNYNYAHSKTRIVVEQAFALWKNKFRIFKKPLENQTPESMAQVIECTMVLHNWIVDLDTSDEDSVEKPWMYIGGDTVYPTEEYLIDNEEAQINRELVKDYLATLQ